MGQSSRLTTPGRREPRFDIDYEYGRQAELQLGDLLDSIARGDGRAESKRKRAIDHKFYIETECLRGGQYVPSGINDTDAHAWVIAIADTEISVVIPTSVLRWYLALDDPSTRDKQCTRGSHPTRGKVIDFCVLLYRYKQRGSR